MTVTLPEQGMVRVTVELPWWAPVIPDFPEVWGNAGINLLAQAMQSLAWNVDSVLHHAQRRDMGPLIRMYLEKYQQVCDQLPIDQEPDDAEQALFVNRALYYSDLVRDQADFWGGLRNKFRQESAQRSRKDAIGYPIKPDVQNSGIDDPARTKSGIPDTDKASLLRTLKAARAQVDDMAKDLWDKRREERELKAKIDEYNKQLCRLEKLLLGEEFVPQTSDDYAQYVPDATEYVLSRLLRWLQRNKADWTQVTVRDETATAAPDDSQSLEERVRSKMRALNVHAFLQRNAGGA